MTKEGLLSVLGVTLSAVSLFLAVWGGEGLAAGLSVTALCLSVAALIYCPRNTYLYSLITGAAVLVCSVLLMTLVSYETLVDGGVSSKFGWIFLSAFVQGAATLPLIPLLFFTLACVFKASYNWVLVSGLGWLVGTGMTISKYLAVLLLENTEVESEIIHNTEMVGSMLVCLIMTILFSFILGRSFKKNRCLVTSNGLEVRE